MNDGPRHWLCSNRLAVSLPDRLARLLARALDRLDQLLRGHLPHETWVRYQRRLDGADAAPAEVELSPLDDATIAALETHAWRDHPQIRTALRLWKQNLRSAFVWREHGEPLCMQWLFGEQDNARLRRLPSWAGMYPPIPAGCGQVENILVLPKGLRRPGGAATPFAHAMYAEAYARGIRRLITHIHEDNTAAHRWAARTGWSAYGTIRRYRFELPLLRGYCLYVHSSLPSKAQRDTAANAPAPLGGSSPPLPR